ncbi:hypothetical protein GGR56DRAFT_681417 [Xylariaceae sp. FL0804]|nr:hypothetical protein GGR56DRAFT_681417 [Xylariaceae sp. FL0804]
MELTDGVIGFADANLTFNKTLVPPFIQAANEPIIIQEPSQVDRGLEVLKRADPPAYMELYNEPDLPYHSDKKTGPQEAARTLEPLLRYNRQHRKTTFLTPATWDPTQLSSAGGYLAQFDDACGGCVSDGEIPWIIATHQYHLDAREVLRSLRAIHARWPGHQIWITELAPATHAQDCPKGPEQVGEWMDAVVRGTRAMPYVGRIFWNSGEWRPKNSNHPDCIHSLTYPDGTATPLLKRYQKLCRGA